MKRLVLAIALASLAAPPAGAPAAPRPRECPKLSVSCPETATPGQPVTFAVNVSGGAADAELTYNWVVPAGIIVSGQGTNVITVDTGGVPGDHLTATVEVGGLPESCPKSESCTVSLFRCRLDKVDEYGDLRWGDERARLDNFAIEVLNGPEFVGYIVGYGGRRSRRGEALRRAERAKKYLTAVRGVPPERVVTVDGGYREGLTVELIIKPKGETPPKGSPTVDPTEVIFIDPAPRRRPRRR